MARPKKEAAPTVKNLVVRPVIQSCGAMHPFESQESTGTLPIIKSVGYCRVFPGSRDYVSYVITSKGNEVLSMEVGTPNMKPIACDEAKINFVTLLDDADQSLEEDRRHIEEDQRRGGMQ